MTLEPRDESSWLNFDLTVSISVSPALADRFRTHLYAALCEIEGDEPEVLAMEDDLPALWARVLDRQLNPFGEIYEVSDEDLWDDYRWFAEVVRG